MKIQNIKISTRLYLALAVILMLTMVLAWEALRQNHALWEGTRLLYDHPLKVRRAVGIFETDITAMHRDMRGLVLGVNDPEIAALLEQIDILKTNAFLQLDVMAALYLGPPEDVANLHTEFVKWNTIREETIRLLHQGKLQEAAERTRPAGIGGAQARKLYQLTATVDDFARKKADSIYREADERKNRMDQRFYIYISVCLLFTLIVSYFLVRWIRTPLKQIAIAAERVREGDFEARSNISSTNEFGTVGAAFDDMAKTLQVEMEINDHTAALVGIMFTETDAKTFCRKLLTQLMNHTGSQIGAVYLLNADQTTFEMFESIGLKAESRTTFSADTREGEFGGALASGLIQHIAAIPDDTCFTFSAVSGEFRPREIITIPVLAEKTPAAVISLAGIRPYDDKAVRLINDVLPIITARLNGVLLYRQIQELAGRLEIQNQELAVQTSELTEMNAELEAQSRELEQASRLKSVFLANMSHELRTPLNSVIALSGVLGRRLGGTIPEEEHGYLEIIERNGKHLLSLINDILDLSRIEAGREEIIPDTFAIRELTNTVVEMLEPLAQEKNIDLINRVDAELPPLFSDPEKVRHVLQNLAANAVKFTENGSVEITARHQNDTLYICVTDTGIGIPANALPYIFDEFHQVDDSASRPYAGTGLGLTIARKYARLLGGDIFVESTPAQGSTFTLRLPLTLSLPEGGDSDSYAEPRPFATIHAGRPADASGRRILLVEDSEAIVIQMTEMLAEQGYDVRTAENGIEALARIQEEVPDAVILDLMMPEMDGFEVLKAIRGTEQTEKLPVLILTARQVTREELGFLRHNHIHQLIRKGDVRRKDLLAAVAGMFAPPAPPEPEKKPVARRTISARPKVLVVEDNPDNLRTLQALLQDTCTVVEACDGKAGVAQAGKHLPDLILMDLALPGMDGYAVLAAIREDEKLRDIPVVAVTASAMKGDQEAILARGFDGYVSKPIDAERLKTTIEKVLYGNQ